MTLCCVTCCVLLTLCVLQTAILLLRIDDIVSGTKKAGAKDQPAKPDEEPKASEGPDA